MEFYSEVKSFLENEGHKYLGGDRGMIFYSDKNGEVHGASQNGLYVAMSKKLVGDDDET